MSFILFITLIATETTMRTLDSRDFTSSVEKLNLVKSSPAIVVA
jgi:hypothetical protein